MAKAKAPEKTVTLYSPKGTKVTVAEKAGEDYVKRGYSKTAPK